MTGGVEHTDGQYQGFSDEKKGGIQFVLFSDKSLDRPVGQSVSMRRRNWSTLPHPFIYLEQTDE